MSRCEIGSQEEIPSSWPWTLFLRKRLKTSSPILQCESSHIPKGLCVIFFSNSVDKLLNFCKNMWQLSISHCNWIEVIVWQIKRWGINTKMVWRNGFVKKQSLCVFYFKVPQQKVNWMSILKDIYIYSVSSTSVTFNVVASTIPELH